MRTLILTAALSVVLVACGQEDVALPSTSALNQSNRGVSGPLYGGDATPATDDTGDGSGGIYEEGTPDYSEPDPNAPPVSDKRGAFSVRTAAEQGGVYAASFDASISVVFVAVNLPTSLEGHHVALVHVSTPDGAAFEQHEVRFAAHVAAADGEVQASHTATGHRFWVAVPVSATQGSWSADLFLDGAAQVIASTHFALN